MYRGIALLVLAFTSLSLHAAVVTEEIMYKVAGKEFTGYMAYDNDIKGKRPGVLVLHEWWGHDDYARKRAEMLAGLGYTAFALDMYGAGKKADHPKDAKAMMMEVFGNMPEAKKRFQTAKQLLMDHKTVASDKIAAVGYCMGGGLALGMGRSGEDLDAIVVLHGSLGTKSPVTKGQMKARVLVLTGGADPNIPKEQVDAFRKEMDAAAVKYEVKVYPDVKHSFSNPKATELGKKFNAPLEYNEAADKDSWNRMKDFLKTSLK